MGSCQRWSDSISEGVCKNLRLFYVHVSLPPAQNVCPHLRLHSFRGGNSRIKERVFAYAACCLREREQSKKKKMSEVDKENEDKSFIVGLVGEKDCLNWGVGEN